MRRSSAAPEPWLPPRPRSAGRRGPRDRRVREHERARPSAAVRSTSRRAEANRLELERRRAVRAADVVRVELPEGDAVREDLARDRGLPEGAETPLGRERQERLLDPTRQVRNPGVVDRPESDALDPEPSQAPVDGAADRLPRGRGSPDLQPAGPPTSAWSRVRACGSRRPAARRQARPRARTSRAGGGLVPTGSSRNESQPIQSAP